MTEAMWSEEIGARVAVIQGLDRIVCEDRPEWEPGELEIIRVCDEHNPEVPLSDCHECAQVSRLL